MIVFLVSFFLCSSPYPFEIERGISLEPVVGLSVYDREKPTLPTGGLRLSYFRTDETDAFTTLELSGGFQSLKNKDLKKWLEMEAQAYEIFNPWVVRVGIGTGLEHRPGDWSPVLSGRVGLGRFFNSNIGFFLDAIGRMLILKAKFEWPPKLSSDYTLDLTLSLLWVF